MAATNFHIANGQIIAPNGQTFVPQGIALLDSEMSAVSPESIIARFPGINSINLAIGADGNGYATAQSNAAIIAWVNDATAKGLVVTLSDYVPGQPQARTGADLQASLNWYASLAKAFAGNPNVWWTTENEVGGNQAAEDQGIYNAIRGAGNNGLIFMEAQDGNALSTAGLDPSIFASMTGIGWNIHVYPWEFNTASGNQADYDNAVKSYVATFQNFAHSADGVMPVLMGEGGNSTSGNGAAPDDPKIAGKFAVTQAILDTAGVAGGLAGYNMWLYDWHGQAGDADTLVNTSTNTLTDFGAQVAAAMAKGTTPAGTGTTPPAGGGTTTPPPPASPDGTKITSAAGKAIVDASGNSWTLVQSAGSGLQIAVNGVVDTSTANVQLLEILGGKMLQENTAGNWYSEPGAGGPWTATTAPAGSGTTTGGTGTTTPPANQPVLIKPGVGSFTDAAGNVYTLSATGDADENGQLMGGGTGTGAMELANGVIYGQDAASLSWYTWNQTAWTPSAAPPATTTTGGTTPPPPPPPPAASPDGTTITAAAASPIIDASGNAWSLVQSASSGLQVAVNGVVDTTTANVKLLETLGGKMVQENTAGSWYSEPGTSGPWTQITAPAGTTTGTTTPPPAPVTTGTGSDSLVLSISEDAYQGNALFTVSVDGKQLAGTFTATASHAAGASQSFTFNGDWAPGAHAVAVNFLNDAYGGSAATDRNLYVNAISYDGTNTNQSAELAGTGPKSFSVTDTTAVPSPAIGSGADTLVLSVSEDAYQGNAQFTVSVDGKQLGGTYTATASHAAGASQAFTFKGDFGAGAHALAVNFLNDAYGGTAATDRNLYVNGVTYNGTATGQSAELAGTGPKSFTVTGGTTPSVSETGDHGSLSKTLAQTGTYAVGGDTFVLTAGNAAAVTLGTGTSQIRFIGAASVALTGGSGQATVTADAGTNKFTAGAGTLDVTGGGGKDAYVFHATSGVLKLEDFSLAKGDTLTIDKSLQASLSQASDGQGGTMLTFGTGATHAVDIHGLAAMPTTSVTWV